MGKPINTAENTTFMASLISANIAKWYSTDTVLSDRKTMLSFSWICPNERAATLISR